MSNVMNVNKKAISECQTDENRGHYWVYNINDLFPIISGTYNNGKVTIPVGPPHIGYSIEATVENGNMNGKAVILSEYRIRIASLTYINGVANGKCTLYDESGWLFFKGEIQNGYRSGYGKEYDHNGKLIFEGLFEGGYRHYKGKEYVENGECTEGFYDKGVRRPDLIPYAAKTGYWRECISKDEVMLCKIDEYGKRYGIGYLYKNDRISVISQWKSGNETTIIKRFADNEMSEYSEGVVVYKGGFSNSLMSNYQYEGEGVKFCSDGQTVLYKGNFRRGKYHGDGALYKKHKPSSCKRWIKGHQMWVVYFWQWTLFIVIVAASVLVTIENVGLGVPLLLILIYCVCIQFFTVRCGMDLAVVTHSVMLKNLLVENNCCNLRSSLDLPPYMVKNITIGDNCFCRVRHFAIDGLNFLETLTIGRGSFTKAEGDKEKLLGEKEAQSRSFQLVNCAKLAVVKIGAFSFADYGVFEVRRLPKLQCLQIGSVKCASYNFYRSSFVIDDLPSLQSIVLGSWAFSCSLSVKLLNLPELKSIQLGISALNGKDVSSCSLRMENLTALESITSGNYSFCYPRHVTLINIPKVNTVNLRYSFEYCQKKTLTNISNRLSRLL